MDDFLFMRLKKTGFLMSLIFRHGLSYTCVSCGVFLARQMRNPYLLFKKKAIWKFKNESWLL